MVNIEPFLLLQYVTEIFKDFSFFNTVLKPIRHSYLTFLLGIMIWTSFSFSCHIVLERRTIIFNHCYLYKKKSSSIVEQSHRKGSSLRVHSHKNKYFSISPYVKFVKLHSTIFLKKCFVKLVVLFWRRNKQSYCKMFEGTCSCGGKKWAEKVRYQSGELNKYSSFFHKRRVRWTINTKWMFFWHFND